MRSCFEIPIPYSFISSIRLLSFLKLRKTPFWASKVELTSEFEIIATLAPFNAAAIPPDRPEIPFPIMTTSYRNCAFIFINRYLVNQDKRFIALDYPFKKGRDIYLKFFLG
jgi:hypothetical protein